MKTKEQKKEIIAKYLADNNINDYETNLEFLYKNAYKIFLKCPTKTFFVGMLKTFHPNLGITLEDIKEVIIDALEVSGIEVEFIDNDWDNLKIIPGDPEFKFDRTTINILDKIYVGSFFQI